MNSNVEDSVHQNLFAFRWARDNRDRLKEHNSSLEFRLHRLRFIEFVERGADGQSAAVQYAKNFAPFAAAHSKGLWKVDVV